MNAPVKFYCPECGAMKDDPTATPPDCTSNEEWCTVAVRDGDAYVPFDDVSEEEKERWRTANLELNVVEGEAVEEDDPLPSHPDEAFDKIEDAQAELEQETLPHPDIPDEVAKDVGEGWG